MKKLLIELLYWFHLPIVLIWMGLFLVPFSLWENKITFHFYYIWTVFLSQLFIGLLYYPLSKKVSIICPLTVAMQYLRGYKITDKKNYEHTYIAEVCQRLGMTISGTKVKIIALATVVLVTVQFFFFS